jgi:hypothetical protein
MRVESIPHVSLSISPFVNAHKLDYDVVYLLVAIVVNITYAILLDAEKRAASFPLSRSSMIDAAQ